MVDDVVSSHTTSLSIRHLMPMRRIQWQLEDAQQDHSSIMTLEFSDVHVFPLIAKMIQETLSKKKFHHVTLIRCFDRVDLVVQAAMKSTKSLTLERCNLNTRYQNTKETPSFVELLGHELSKFTTVIKSLRLLSHSFGSNHPQDAIALGQGLALTATLSTLDLSDCRFLQNDNGENWRNILQGLKYNSTIHNLNLNSCGLLDEQLADMIEQLQDHPRLEHLDLSYNFIDSQACFAIASLLLRNQLQSLTLKGTRQPFDVRPLITSLESNTSLISLSLEENSLPQLQLIQFTKVIRVNQRLKHLILLPRGHCQMERNGLQEFLHAMQTNSTLERLELSEDVLDADVALILRQILFLTLWNQAGRLRRLRRQQQQQKQKQQQLFDQRQEQPTPFGLWPFALSRLGSHIVALCRSTRNAQKVAGISFLNQVEATAIFGILTNAPHLVSSVVQ